MELTYEAILKGNEVEWLGKVPEAINGGKPLRVQIVVLEQKSSQRKQTDPKAMLVALEKIASQGGVKSIPDPLAWQIETRKDRPLPGRET
jgi:hypothetical protein